MLKCTQIQCITKITYLHQINTLLIVYKSIYDDACGCGIGFNNATMLAYEPKMKPKIPNSIMPMSFHRTQ